MSIFDAITDYFCDKEKLTQFAGNEITPYIAESTELLVETLAIGKKILTLSSDDTSFLAQYFSNQLIYANNFERPGLPSIHLTNTFDKFNDSSQTSGLAQQISTLAEPQDCILMIAGRMNTSQLEHIITVILENSLNMIVITSSLNKDLVSLVPPDQIAIEIPQSTNTESSFSLHFHIVELLSQLIEKRLFSGF